MLWLKLIHKVGDGQLPDKSSKNVVHSFGKDGSPKKIPSTLYVVNVATGDRVLRISRDEFAEQPDGEFWLKKASKADPSLSVEQLAIDFHALPG